MEPLSQTPGAAEAMFARRFRTLTGGDGPVSFATFMDLALFDAEAGYYAAERERVGRSPGTDFYTAASLGRVFGPLVAAAAERLLTAAGAAARDHVFVEIGAEPGRSVLAGVAHPFAGCETIRLADHARHPGPPARAVVFSNELFDAQPFHRLTWREGAWRELGVRFAADGAPAWVELPALSPELDALRAALPLSSTDGYILDVPWRAARLLEQLVAPGWRGLFLALDYGRTWGEITADYPQGTGRAYAAHRQSGDLLAMPGGQDLTCHVCWDWLEDGLRRAGFVQVARMSQESFFVTHATAAIEAIMRAGAGPLSPERSQLKQLLHPALMGQRFEALWGVRL